MKKWILANLAGLLALSAAAQPFVSGRPAPENRLFVSPAVEAQIAQTARLLTNPKLAWMFTNCYPNTLDTKRQFALLKEQFDKERRAGAAAKRKPLNDNEVADAAKLLSEKWTGKLF